MDATGEYLIRFYEVYNHLDIRELDNDNLKDLANSLNNWKLEAERELYHRGL